MVNRNWNSWEETLSDLTHGTLGYVVVILTLNMLNCFKNQKTSCTGMHILYQWAVFNRRRPNSQWCNPIYFAYSILSIQCLLMPWQLKEPGHQLAWYVPSSEYSISSIRRVNCAIFKYNLVISYMIRVKSAAAWYECHMTWLVINHHWFR